MATEVVQRKNQVLIVGCDQQITSRLRSVMHSNGYVPVIVAAADAIRTKFVEKEMASIIWCVRCVQSESFPQLQSLRGHVWGAPLLAVVGGGSVEERCALLVAGADACIDASCTDRELAASIGALARMVSRLTSMDFFGGKFRLDSSERRLERFDCFPVRQTFLPHHEFLLLRLLAHGSPRTVMYRTIDSCIWNRSMVGCEPTRRKLIDRLRSVLAGVGGLYVVTDLGRGLRLEDDVP